MNKKNLSFFIIGLLTLLFISKYIQSNTQRMDFTGAGVLFTDGKQFLTGLQKRDENLVWDGFGGSRNPGEDPLTTAFREVFEEMFEIQEGLDQAISMAKQLITPKQVIQRGSYVVYICDLNDVLTFCKIAKQARLASPLYKIIPSSFATLLHKRLNSDKAEIKELRLITYENMVLGNHPVAETFLEDMKILG